MHCNPTTVAAAPLHNKLGLFRQEGRGCHAACLRARAEFLGGIGRASLRYVLGTTDTGSASDSRVAMSLPEQSKPS